MRVVLDGMGGDNAPVEIVKGAVQATELVDDEIIIVGPEKRIKQELKNNKYKGDQISVVDANEVITMEDSPVKAIRRKTDSSLVVALNMIKDGKGDLLISGGNTGALIVGSRMVLGRIDGIDRPVLASVYLNLNGEPGILVDAGASAESKANNLLESAMMGSIYMEKVWGRPNPRIGLVNLGAEEGKGTSVTKEAYQKLKGSDLNFVGNLEGREVPIGAADVIVCDGFVGNVILKLTEGLAMSILKLIKDQFLTNAKSKVAGLLMKNQLASMKEQFNYEEYGGAPVLGVQGPVLKIHGSSTADAVRNAIVKGIPYARENVVEVIRKSIFEFQEDIEILDE